MKQKALIQKHEYSISNVLLFYFPCIFSGILQAIRALMIVAILVGVIAVFIGFFCLKCLNMRSMDLLTKGKLVLSAGILFIIAGKQKLIITHAVSKLNPTDLSVWFYYVNKLLLLQ